MTHTTTQTITPAWHESAQDLRAMSQVQLLAEYNRLSPTKRRAKFDSKQEAIARISALHAVGPADRKD
jgi:indole-3-glycerol phosphate synthase